MPKLQSFGSCSRKCPREPCSWLTCSCLGAKEAVHTGHRFHPTSKSSRNNLTFSFLLHLEIKSSPDLFCHLRPFQFSLRTKKLHGRLVTSTYHQMETPLASTCNNAARKHVEFKLKPFPESPSCVLSQRAPVMNITNKMTA